jgi:hypothetical protein
MAIVKRNAFGLKEKPTPPPKNEEKKPDTKAEDLNIVVSGFGARGGKKMVFFKIPNEEKKGKYNFYTVDVDSTDANPIDVVKLDEEFITIRYKGGTHTLELASVQNKANKQAPKTAAKSPQPGGPNVAGGRGPAQTSIAGRVPSNPTMAGAAIGFTLVLVHIVAIPLTGTSVNPARSFGPALFVGGEALAQVWLFIVAPLVGAVIAWGLWKFIRVDAVKS